MDMADLGHNLIFNLENHWKGEEVPVWTEGWGGGSAGVAVNWVIVCPCPQPWQIVSSAVPGKHQEGRLEGEHIWGIRRKTWVEACSKSLRRHCLFLCEAEDGLQAAERARKGAPRCFSPLEN